MQKEKLIQIKYVVFDRLLGCAILWIPEMIFTQPTVFVGQGREDIFSSTAP